MIVRNVRDKAVMETTYLAHGGAIAQMILDRRVLKEIGFLAAGRCHLDTDGIESQSVE